MRNPLEKLTEPEMELPPRVRSHAVGHQVHCDPVESVRQVEPEWPEWRDGRYPEAGRTEEPGRIDLPGRRPVVAGIGEGVHVELLVKPEADLTREGEEGVAERGRIRAVLVGRGVEAGRRDGELRVPSERLAILYTAHRELLLEEERPRVTEERTGPGRDAHDELDRL